GVVFDTHDAHQSDRVGELRVVRGDDEVARPAQHEPGCDALALYRGDRRFGDVAPAPGVIQVTPGLPVVVVLGDKLAVGPPRTQGAPVSRRIDARHVVPGGEVLAGGGQDDDPDLGVIVGAAPRVVEVLEDPGRLSIGGVGAVEG